MNLHTAGEPLVGAVRLAHRATTRRRATGAAAISGSTMRRSTRRAPRLGPVRGSCTPLNPVPEGGLTVRGTGEGAAEVALGAPLRHGVGARRIRPRTPIKG